MMKEMKMGAYTYKDENYNFKFNTNLSAHEKRVFVRTVVGSLVGDTYYDSVLRDIIFDYTIILMLTDADMSFLKTMNEDGEVITDVELLEEFLLETNIIEIVKANAFPAIFDELNNAVDKSIEYRTGIHPNPLNQALTNLVNTLERKVNEVDLSSMMEMANMFAGMTGELTSDSVVDAYMRSDMHKKNLEEIEKSKKRRVEFAEEMDKAIKSVEDKKVN